MSEEFNKLNAEEEIKAENEFLKMKMMLEYGTDIHFSCSAPPEIENDLLKYIMAFESRGANLVYTTVYEKIGSPTHFKKVDEITDVDIETEYHKLMDYMNAHGVGLGCCSPAISIRELYRFVTEELFKKEMADMNIPGMVSSFIYDEFHPDHEYDNKRVALGECINYIFSKEPFNAMGQFDREKLQINDHISLSEENFQRIINRFKELFSEINLLHAEVENCSFNENNCTVKGTYAVELTANHEKINIGGNWTVDFLFRDDCGYWYIKKVCLGGIDL